MAAKSKPSTTPAAIAFTTTAAQAHEQNVRGLTRDLDEAKMKLKREIEYEVTRLQRALQMMELGELPHTSDVGQLPSARELVIEARVLSRAIESANGFAKMINA